MTVLCVGWPADPPCTVYGAMHGCDLEDGHLSAHVCACGVDARGQQLSPNARAERRRRPYRAKPKPTRAPVRDPGEWKARSG